MMKTCTALAVSAALLLIPAAASAAVSTFFGEDLSPVAGPPATNIPNSLAAQSDFLSALTQEWTWDTESEVSPPSPVVFTGPSGTLGATIFGDATTSSAFAGAAYATSGVNVLGGTEGWTLRFDVPINAIGMFGIGIPGEDPQESQIRLEITYTDGTVALFNSLNTLGIDDPSLFYFGVVDTEKAFTQVVFRALASTLVQIAVDDITVGTVGRVPEPAPAGLVLLGAGLAFMGRRYRRCRT